MAPSWLLTIFLLLGYASATIIMPGRLGVVSRNTRIKLNAKSSSYLDDFKTYNYTQTLDHFNYRPDSYTTFQQRYFIKSKYWGGAGTGSPIFVYLGAEEAVDEDIPIIGSIVDFASKFNGLIVFIEHRYYGTSMPFGSQNEAYKNASTLGYFNSAQALADYAEVILYLKEKFSSEKSPVIVTGGSYGGMLAAWFRLKYPHVAHGAIAVSAPILQFLGLTPQEKYFSIVTEDIKRASEHCHDTIRKSWSVIDRIASQKDGLTYLTQKFNACYPLNSTSDLKNSLINTYAGVAQYDYVLSTSSYRVDKLCQAINGNSKGGDIISKISAGFAADHGNQCYDFSTDSSFDMYNGWNWQTCTDMVIPIGIMNNTMFQASPFDLKDYTQYCQEAYGDTVRPRSHWITTEFGGQDIGSVLKKFGSNILFSNGLKDPYSGGGVLHNISDTIVAVTAPEGAHCSDIYPSTKHDPKWLIKMRAFEVNILKGWLEAFDA